MNEQIFLPSKLNFNLCQPKSTKPTIIYAVVYFQGRQYKINTGMKVLPSQWNKKRQCAIVSNCQSELDNSNNLLANGKINEILFGFQAFLNYICKCPNEVRNFYEVLKTYINREMATRKKNKKITFETEFRGLVYEMSQERQTKYKRLVEAIIDYMKNNSIDLEWSSISKEMLYDFACDMVKSTNMQVRTFNDKVDNIYFLMNHADTHEYLTWYDKQRWNKYFHKLSDKRDEEERQSVNVVLTDKEVTQLYQTNFDTPIKNEVRDIFTFLCLTGLSVGDLLKMWDNDFITWVDEHNIQIKRNKTGVHAMIPLFDNRVKELYNRYRDGFPYTKIKGKRTDDKIKLTANESGLLNKTLHQIIKEVGFDHEIPVSRSYVCCRDGRIEIKTITEMRLMSDEMTIYDSRHTFITSAYYIGMSKEQIIDIVGHTSTKMVEKVYLKLDKGKEAEAKARRNNEFYRGQNQGRITINSHQQTMHSVSGEADTQNLFHGLYKDSIRETIAAESKLKEQGKQITALSQMVRIEEQQVVIIQERYNELRQAVLQGYGTELLEADSELDEMNEVINQQNEPWE